MATLALLFVIVSMDGVAGEFDIGIRAGGTMPFYHQTFPIDVSLPSRQGLTIRQQGELAIDARGGLLIGAGFRFWANGIVGIEGRYDSGAIDLGVHEPMFFVAMGPPLPMTISEFPVESSVPVEADRLTPLSLNLALRSGRRARIVLSGGVSYLPALSLNVRQRFVLGFGLLDYALPTIEAGGEIDGRIGANAGLSFEVPVGRSMALFMEGRGFVFESERFEWDESEFFGIDPLGRIIVEEIRKSQRPVEFTPTFCHFAVGVIFRL